MTERRTNQEIVYEALIEGHEVIIDGYTYRMAEGGDIAFKAQVIDGSVETTVWMSWLMGSATMKDFYWLCNKMSEVERVAVVANLALNKSR